MQIKLLGLETFCKEAEHANKPKAPSCYLLTLCCTAMQRPRSHYKITAKRSKKILNSSSLFSTLIQDIFLFFEGVNSIGLEVFTC